MKQITYSKNWNNKLSCDSFATVRLYEPNQFELGESYEIVCDNDIMGVAKIVALRELELVELTDELAYLDAGCSASEMDKILREIYPSITDKSILESAIFKYIAD
ncbi:MAG: hypothetical protein R3Y22_06320 [Bacteroidales bacterium]